VKNVNVNVKLKVKESESECKSLSQRRGAEESLHQLLCVIIGVP
jgi:hypothetical protein